MKMRRRRNLLVHLKSFTKKSHTIPKLNLNPALALFVTLTTKELEAIKIDSKVRNLNPKQEAALKSLKENTKITIKSSDKGGNIVLMDNILYENLCTKTLNNKKCYSKIPPSMVEKSNDEFYMLVDEALNEVVITKEM